MTAPTIDPLPALPTFPPGPGLPDQPGVFIPQFLAFLNALRTFSTQANDVAAYVGAGGSTASTTVGLASAVAALALASPALATTNTFRTEGYTATADGGEAWYRRISAIEADEPGMLTSSDGVRLGLVKSQPISLEMFGGKRNDPTAGALNDAAIEAIKDFDKNIPYPGWYAANTATINLWKGDYWFADPAGHDIKTTRDLIGHGGGVALAGGQLGTRCIGPNNWKFLRHQSFNTVGETVESPSTTMASGSSVQNIAFVAHNDTEAGGLNDITSGYALHPRTPIAVFNCRFVYFWNGIFNNAASGSGGATEGQASHCSYSHCSFEQNRNGGLWNDDQADNSVTLVHHCNFIANGRCGFYAGDFLGGGIDGTCHFRDNGCRTDYFNVSSQCNYGGNWYYVNETATMATTDAALRVGNPSTNSLWTTVGAGGTGWAQYPDFATFVGTFQKGGPVVADRGLNARYVAVEYYSEGGQPPCFWNALSFIAPGTSGSGDVGYGAGIIDGKFVSNNTAMFGATTARSTSNSLPQLKVQNSGPTAAGAYARLDFTQGYEADGVTPMVVAGIRAWPSTSSQATAEGVMYLFTRNYAGGGTITDLLQLDGRTGSHPALGPVTAGGLDLAYAGLEFRRAYLSDGVYVAGNKVLGARDTGWTADTGTAKKTATATYAVGSALTVGATYVQAEHTAIITRQALVEAALRDATQEIKALKDALIAHGVIGA